MGTVNEYEPTPQKNQHPAIWPLVIESLVGKVGVPEALIEDMKARDQFGRKKYGTPLQPFNGRDAVRDAYQEALDLCVYTKQATMEHPKDESLQDVHTNAIQCAIQLRKILDRGCFG